MSKHERRYGRVPVSLEVRYRTTGSFLVSYSMNLSKGGVFIETDQLLDIGTQLSVQFQVPNTDQPIETTARVIWARYPDNAEKLPPGLGLQFASLETSIGQMIDGLVQKFSGMRLMAVSATSSGVDRLGRYLRSIIHCEVVPCTSPEEFTTGIGERIDLALIDLDSSGPEGVVIVGLASSGTPPIPIVALSRDPQRRSLAKQEGAGVLLHNPPPFEELRLRVLEALGKPLQTTKQP